MTHQALDPSCVLLKLTFRHDGFWPRHGLTVHGSIPSTCSHGSRDEVHGVTTLVVA